MLFNVAVIFTVAFTVTFTVAIAFTVAFAVAVAVVVVHLVRSHISPMPVFLPNNENISEARRLWFTDITVSINSMLVRFWRCRVIMPALLNTRLHSIWDPGIPIMCIATLDRCGNCSWCSFHHLSMSMSVAVLAIPPAI